MHKILQDALQERIVGYMAEHHSDFQHRKSMPKGAGKSVLFQKKYKSGFIKYIQVKFVQDRDYVQLNMQWSKLNRFPDELSVDTLIVYKAAKDITILDKYDETWLSLDELDDNSVFKLTVTSPDSTFVEKYYTPERYREIEEFSFSEDFDASADKFYEKVSIYDWNLTVMCFGNEVLDKEDIARILGDMPDKICQKITTKVIPYFEALEARLGILEK